MPKRLCSQSKKTYEIKGLKESQHLNPLVNWEKFRSITHAYLQKNPSSSFFMNWKELRNPARATFNDMKISWRYSQRPTLKIPKFVFMYDLGKFLS